MVTTLPRQRLQVDAVALAVEGQLQPVVDQALARQPVADAGLGEDVDRALLQQAGADAGAQIFGRAPLQHDALDAGEAQQPRQQQPCRAAADNSNLCAHAPS